MALVGRSDDHLDASVLRAAIRGRVVGDGQVGPVCEDAYGSRGEYAVRLPDEVLLDRRRTLAGQGHIARRVARRVRVSMDLHDRLDPTAIIAWV